MNIEEESKQQSSNLMEAQEYKDCSRKSPSRTRGRPPFSAALRAIDPLGASVRETESASSSFDLNNL